MKTKANVYKLEATSELHITPAATRDNIQNLPRVRVTLGTALGDLTFIITPEEAANYPLAAEFEVVIQPRGVQ
jgi:hypothetical protein